MADTLNVLFICDGNSARSIIAEAIMNRIGAPKFRAYSAGPNPDEVVNPHALALLKSQNFKTEDYQTRSLDDFRGAGAPELRFVFSLSDNADVAARGPWPGNPMIAHWTIPDPELVTGSDAEIGLAFAETFRQLTNRISLLVNLPLDSLDALTLQARLDAIGKKGD